MSGVRRQPKPPERVRDAERSRAALLDAAQTEFADKGLAGARVGAIAERAGLNKQLISYYFGGKDGLYRAVVDRRRELTAAFDQPGTSLPDLVQKYFAAFAGQPEQQRLFLRETFEVDHSEVAHDPHDVDLEGLRARQAAGEIGPELDPAFVLLFLQAMGVSSAIFPGDVRRLTGLDPHSAEYQERAADQLAKIVRRLA